MFSIRLVSSISNLVPAVGRLDWNLVEMLTVGPWSWLQAGNPILAQGPLEMDTACLRPWAIIPVVCCRVWFLCTVPRSG